MPRNITVTFADGSTHVYNNAPDNITPDQVSERAQKDFGRTVTNIDGGRDGYIAASAKAGLKSLVSVGAGLINDVFGVSEAELAKVYKDDPAGLAKAKASSGFWFGRQAENWAKSADESRANLNTSGQAAAAKKYATLDPAQSAFLSPTKLAGDVLDSLPTSLAMGLTAYLTRNAGAAAEAEALAAGVGAAEARNLGIQAASKTAARWGAGSEGGVGYEQQKQQVRDEVSKMPQKLFDKSPVYQNLLKQGYAPENAKVLMAAKLGEQAGLDAGMIDAGTNMVGGHFLGKIIGEGGGLLSRAGKGFADEAAVETVQSAGEQLAQNAAERTLDPSIALSKGVGESALQGFAVGGLSGAGTTAVAGVDYRKAVTRLSDRYAATQRPIAPGIRATSAAEASVLTPDDHASPIPNDLIARGKIDVADATAKSDADSILSAAGMPATGKRVQIAMPDGTTHTGTVRDAFDTDAGDLGRASGIAVDLDNGTVFTEHFDTLKDAGVSITPHDDQAAKGGKAVPVDDGAALAQSIFGDKARITSGYRSAEHPLSRANPNSWHTKSHAAVDMAPIPGMTFDEAKAAIEGKGYTLIEALNETGKGRSAWATGDHWHFVIGKGGTQTAQATGLPAPAPSVTPAPAQQQAQEEQATPPSFGQMVGEPIDNEWSRFSDTSGTLGVPRADMPQIKAEHRGAMVNFLNARGIEHQEETVPADSLKPTQAEFSNRKVLKARDFEGGDRAILTSSDGYVLDGHHQWMGALSKGEDVRTIRLDAPIATLLKVVPEMPSVTTADGSTDTKPVEIKPAPEQKEPPAQPLSNSQQLPNGSAVPNAGAAGPAAKVEPLTDKSVIVRGLDNSEASKAIIARGLPAKGIPLWNAKAGGWVVSKKHEAKVRDVIAALASESSTQNPQETAKNEGKKGQESNTPTPVKKSNDVHAQIDAGFAANREAMGKFNPGDKVEWDHANFYRDGRSRTFTGTVDKVQSAEQGTIRVISDTGGDVTAAARTLRHTANQEPAPQKTATPAAEPAPESKVPYDRPAGNGNSNAVDEAAPVPTTGKAGAAATYGAQNKLFTADAAEKARALLRAKMNQLNAGFDPEIAQAGLTLMGYHIEAGARSFIDAARAVASDLGMTPTDLRNSLRSWYSSARMWMEDNGHDIRGMDDDAAVRVDLSRIDQWGAEQATNPVEDAAKPAQPSDLPSLFRDKLLNGETFRSITEARKAVEQATGEKIESGTPRAKEIDEAIEAGVVQAARQIAAKGMAPADTYQALVDLYQRQPALNVRTSTSIEQQAYSTPVPLAFLASHRAGITQDTTVYEPTAGNGALLIDARATYVTANELNPDRAVQLRAIMRGATITQEDATEHNPDGQFDVVIANPPFGPIKDESGVNRVFDLGDGYQTREIDHAIAIHALEAMKDNGRAALIVGSIPKTVTSDDARSDAYNVKAKREFYLRLYNTYNVTDHFTVAGELYNRQGAGWPVDVIIIDGRGKSALRVPAADVPRQYTSWEQLKEALDGRQNPDAPVRESTGNPAEIGARQEGDDGAVRGRIRGERPEPGGRQDGNPEPVRSRSGDEQSARPGLVQPTSRDNGVAPQSAERGGVARPAPVAKAGLVGGENALQVAYSPASTKASLGTLVPVNMQTSARAALDALQARVGHVDDYVAEKLGFDPKTIGDALSAEQVDAVALAIDNMERGAGFIIGDQTGIGKGRVVASIIRYALREGRRPIFVTEKPNLYADMYRDMNDIGIPQMLGHPVKILMTNAGENVPLDDAGENVLKTPAAAKHNRHLAEVAAGSGDYDVVFTTYAQMQSFRGSTTERQAVLRAMAPGSILIFDESHNAGGQGSGKKAGKGEKEAAPNRAEFARELAKAAHGVFFSSATYAKRPDVMDLYASTDMSLAVPDVNKLGDAIARGGIPMQQVIASNLAEAGQYVRRERSFDGVTYDTPVVPVDREAYSRFTDALQAIQTFSEKFVKTAVNGIDRDMKAQGQAITGDNSTGGAGAESTNFTAIMHNLIDQMLLAMKAPDAAERAIKAIQEGKKPVITVANTMASFLDEFAADNGISPGDSIALDFSNLLLRYLDRTRIITIRKPFSKEKGERHRLTDGELGQYGVDAFNAARAAIESLDLTALPISPIDYIRGEIEKAGFRIGEITGRNSTIEYGPDGSMMFKRRPSSENSIAGRRRAISGFNGGTIEAMLLNQAGSTGLSLHASKTFKDQKPRHMIIAQAEKNIDTHMQMLGRIHRSGQVVLPSYDQLTADVPAEKRPTAILAKKMASLNANTTGSRDSALSADSIDFLNQYGDEIAARMMEQDPDLHERLAEPLKSDEKTEELPRIDAARKVTGRLVLLPLKEQEQFYEAFIQEYRDFLAQKEAAGESALEAKTLPIDAKTMDRKQVVAPTKPGSPFGEGVYLETVDAKRLGKSFSPDQVVDMTAKAINADAPDGDPRVRLAKLDAAGREWITNFSRAPIQDFADYRRGVEDGITDEKRLEKVKAQHDDNLQRFRDVMMVAYPGAGVRLQTEMGAMYGVVIKVEKHGKPRNPLALSGFRVTFALADSSRALTLPVSQLVTGNPEFGRVAVQKADSIGQMPMLDAFESMQRAAREKRQIMTGNILAAFDHINGKGQIVNFVTDEGDVRPGIMMPRDFDYQKAMAEKPVQFRTTQQIMQWLLSGRVATAEGLTIKKTGNELEIDAAAAKSVGGQYYLNRKVQDAIGRVFVKRGNVMRAYADLSQIERVIDALREDAKAVFTAKEDLSEARAIVASDPSSAKFSIPDDQPVADLTGKELGPISDILDMGRKARAWFKAHLRAKTITSSDGAKVSFGRVGESKINGGDRIFSAVPAIADIISKGEHAGPIAPSEKWGARGVIGTHTYTAPVKIGNEVRRYGVMVHEMADGRRFYYLTDNPGDYVGGQPIKAEGRKYALPEVEVTADNLNLFSVDEESNGAFLPVEEIPDELAARYAARDAEQMEMGADARAEREQYQAAMDQLNARMKAMGLSERVALQVNNKLTRADNASGSYRNSLIKIALSSKQSPLDTLNHEAIHALRDLGLIYDGEWAVLARAARADTAMMSSIRRRYAHLNLSEDGLVEEAIADRFKNWAANPQAETGIINRAFKRLRDFIEALGNALRGNGFNTVEDVMRAIDTGQMGGREIGAGGRGNYRASIPESPEFDSAETERRFQEAKAGVGSAQSLIDRLKETAEHTWHGLTRHWIALPNEPKYSALQQKLRAIESAPQHARERTVAMLEDMVKGFSKEDLDLFTRKVILDDLAWDAANERDLPFGFTPGSLTEEKAKIDRILMADPDQRIWKAAMKRKLANRQIAQELVAAGVLEAEQIKNPAYYRHQVLEYARAQANYARTPGQKLKTPKWAKRMGSTLDINANLLEAEFDWLNRAFVDIPVAQTIEWIKQSPHNILEDLRQQAKDSNKDGIAAKLQEAQDTIDDQQSTDDERAQAAILIDTEKGFRQSIAMGFDLVRQHLKDDEIKVPARFQSAADAIEGGKGAVGDPPFAFLSWMLDTDQPGAMGAAMVMKAIGQRRSWTKNLLGRDYINDQDAGELVKRLAPEGYRTWQPDEGKLLFTVKTLPEHAIDAMIAQLDAPAGIEPTVFRAALEGARSQLAMGGDRYTMILPEEVADTLSNLRRAENDGLFEHLAREPLRAWKRWVLVNPRRFFKYNLNNLTGDLDAVLAGNPQLLKQVGRAARELADVKLGRVKASDRYNEAVARGVFDSGLSVQEIPDINTLAPFERFAKQPGAINKVTMIPLRKAWNALQGATQWRENIFRYAAYLDYVERLERGDSQSSVGYGASRPNMVDAVPDMKDRAAMMARDLLGDYGAISHYGSWLRETIIPFWSWTEINTRRYWRLSANAYSQGIGKGLAVGGGMALTSGARTTAWLAIRMAAMYGLFSLWNALFFGDEEDELDDNQKRQMHVILGRNANGDIITLRTQGALSDMLGWFGMADIAKLYKDYELGRTDFTEIPKGIFKSAVNKLALSVSPVISVPIEASTGKKLWPDVFNPRPINDRWRNFLSSFSLENEYDMAMDKPSRGYGRSWQEAFIYRRDPGEIAYNEARGIAYDWLKREKGQEFDGGFTSKRSEATRDYRTALRYGDKEAADKALRKMIELGVDAGDFQQMVKRAAPLGPISKKDQQAFISSLTKDEYDTFVRAQRWYEETFLMPRGGG